LGSKFRTQAGSSFIFSLRSEELSANQTLLVATSLSHDINNNEWKENELWVPGAPSHPRSFVSYPRYLLASCLRFDLHQNLTFNIVRPISLLRALTMMQIISLLGISTTRRSFKVKYTPCLIDNDVVLSITTLERRYRPGWLGVKGDVFFFFFFFFCTLYMLVRACCPALCTRLFQQLCIEVAVNRNRTCQIPFVPTK
jgi:hypothetical protein